ncbi:MAG: hypothetical protein ACOVS5_02085 [Oligoflexus sp.]|jgi:hypothetical protein
MQSIRMLLVLLSLCPLHELWAQTEAKNPKVAEVEAYLSQKIITYMNSRFPSMPVLVFVQVDPLRRSQTPLAEPIAREILPYFNEVPAEQPVDEWDDHQRSVHDLIPRIRSVNIKITVPDLVSNDELYEMRDSLFSNLALIGGRDRIEFERKQWLQKQTWPYEEMIMVGIAVSILLIGLYVILRNFVQALTTTFKESAPKTTQSAPPPPMPLALAQKPDQDKVATSSTMQINDSIRVADKLRVILKSLGDDPAFPTLEDMMALEEKVDEDPAFIGTLLQEMPHQMQEEIFKRSSSERWLEAFFINKTPDIEKFNFVQKLSHHKRDEKLRNWTDLLIVLWRLGDQLGPFIKGIDQRDALGILAWMPTKISIPLARENFPGGWGILLRHDFKPNPLPESALEALKAKALAIKGYKSFDLLQRYRHERGLLDFLRTCSLEEEREIYRASRPDASIHTVRPPFFIVFEAPEDELRYVADRFSAADWGKALFKIDRSLRQRITQYFSESKNYQMIEVLKQYDRFGLGDEEVGVMREQIARLLNQGQKDKQASSQKPQRSGGDATSPAVREQSEGGPKNDTPTAA